MGEQIFHPGELKVAQWELMKQYAPVKAGLSKKASVSFCWNNLQILWNCRFFPETDSPEGSRSWLLYSSSPTKSCLIKTIFKNASLKNPLIHLATIYWASIMCRVLGAVADDQLKRYIRDGRWRVCHSFPEGKLTYSDCDLITHPSQSYSYNQWKQKLLIWKTRHT